MNSITDEIKKLRKGNGIVIDYTNSNRYRIVAIEPDGSKTAYYFSTPIYNQKSRKAIDIKFHTNENTLYAIGSNTNITIANDIRTDNYEGSCIISLSEPVQYISNHELLCGKQRIYPTTNGVAIESFCQDGHGYTLSLEINKPFLDIRANDKYFALMSERFRPFVTVSCIGTLDSNKNIISPAKLTFQKITDRKYTVNISPCSPLGRYVLLEVNLYEPKLFQDTTVESNNPTVNNAFGSIGFLGTTSEFGEQWLYTRPDFSKMTEMNGKKITNAVLHLPNLGNSHIELACTKVSSRFCSFGSTWDNKIAEMGDSNISQIGNGYIDINLTHMITDRIGNILKEEGFILRSKKKDCGFLIVPTGDSYLNPQILEINYY